MSVPLTLLGLLERGPSHGYDLKRDYDAYFGRVTSQFAAAGSTYPDPASTVTSLAPTQQVFFTNALNNPDQLRQRVALALSEIWVTSGFTVPPQGMAPYMRLLLQDAFVQLSHADERRDAESGDGPLSRHGEQR